MQAPAFDPRTPARLRSDLILSRQTAANAPVLVVKDPATERFFRFREIEAFIIDQLDGCAPLDSIQATVQQRFDAPLPLPTLEQFVQRLRAFRLLEDDAASPTRSPLGRVNGSVFYLRVRAWNPDRFLARLAPKLQVCFSRPFMVGSALLIALAAAITLLDWGEIQRDLPRLYTAQSFALAYLTILIVVGIHECAHGLTCKFYGGNVREIGFLLLYFQPAFYCNVSDAWLFRSKAHRLWVTFAGAYAEIIVWALATLTWRVSDPSTIPNYLALVVMTTSGVKTLFNLNPLIKLDGYYLLSDVLDIPNLRANALAYVGSIPRRVWGAEATGPKRVTSRERRIYLGYGVLAWTYSIWLLFIIAVALGTFLTSQYQAWGFAVFVALLVGVFQRPLKRMLPAKGGIMAGSGIRRAIRWIVRLGVVGGAAAALFLVHADLRVSGPFTVLPVRNADVRAEVEGILESIYVDEGDTVKQGAPIATLSHRENRSELRKINADLDEKQARLKLLRAGARPEEIEMARTQVTKAEERVTYAEGRLDRDQTLFDRTLLSRQQLEESKEQKGLRVRELQEARDRLQLLLAGSRAEEVEAIEAEINRLEAQKAFLREQQGLLQVFSPIDGVVATRKPKDSIGQAVKKGDLITRVHDLRTVTVEIAVPEQEIADVHQGQRTVLTARAFPQTRLEGSVASIAPVATEPDDPRAPRTIVVTTQLANLSLLLKPEMTGQAKIYCGTHRLIDLVSRRVVRFFRVEFWSWW
jgi:putative peptide zinc metalloprotease protein